jgi:hypothetical protein
MEQLKASLCEQTRSDTMDMSIETLLCGVGTINSVVVGTTPTRASLETVYMEV